ncbi:MAG TPA: polyprenyl synthetase family protein, partial [Acidimicrobiia bacterium]|nr:polyprenyl synthetase family protein [Acidimicrobiia bacterium]
DDLLGVFGDEDVIGKPVGDDLREGKLTPLLAVALGRAAPSERAVLERVGRPDLDDGAIKELQDALVVSGARAAIEAEIDALVGDAQGAIDRAPLEERARRWLHELAAYVGWRDR